MNPLHPDAMTAAERLAELAEILWKTLEMWQSRSGLGNSPRTLLGELARISSHDVVLPTAAHGDIGLRCVTQPDAAQAALLDRLGLVLPKRMRLSENQRPALARLKPTPSSKCSGDFSAKALIQLLRPTDCAQVGPSRTLGSPQVH
jgi:hypothetical protein